MRECIQRPGELIYIPFGWHHAIVNLEVSCAIAHTLITPASLPPAWSGLRTTYPSFANTLRELLQNRRPELAELLPPVEADGDIDSAADQVTQDVLASSVVSLCASELYHRKPPALKQSDAATAELSAATVGGRRYLLPSRRSHRAAHASSKPGSTRTKGLASTLRACREGDTLLEVPLSACVTSADLPREIAARLPPTDSFGRLLLAVTRRSRTVQTPSPSCDVLPRDVWRGGSRDDDGIVV